MKANSDSVGITQYASALERLYQRRWFGIKLGLENIQRLSDVLGSPHEQLRFIHVAGTNGKGSTCAMLESVYRHAGYRVGLFMSPHLVSFRERIQINRYPIQAACVVRYLERVEQAIARSCVGLEPTFFEVVTAMALLYFAEQGVDLVIWETGMGGRLDATNIVDPLASVITNVGYDHQQWLGSTLREIAFEKAGIIKPRRPVVLGSTDQDVLDVVGGRCLECGSPLYIVPPEAACHPPFSKLSLTLRGPHQRHNAAIAAQVVQLLRARLPVRESELIQGLEEAFLAGRFQVITQGDTILVVDGAHNPPAARALAEALKAEFGEQQWAFVVGCLRDKDWPNVWRQLQALCRSLYLVPVPSSRSADPQELARLVRESRPDLPVIVCGSLEEALAKSSGERYRVVTGSLYLVGHCLTVLGYFATPDPDHQGDWVCKPQSTFPAK